MSQDIFEIKCALVFRRKPLSHQVEDSEVMLLRWQVNQTGLFQHVGVHVGLNMTHGI